MTRVIEIVTSGPPSPYKNYDFREYLVGVIPNYENTNSIFKWIEKLYTISLEINPGFDPE